ncbi:hypothetical protein SUGI_1006760 [Cryptomeria japonica]|nr:hypothetical protein SUGI_1006760 [Cryptomeria japonica]
MGVADECQHAFLEFKRKKVHGYVVLKIHESPYLFDKNRDCKHTLKSRGRGPIYFRRVKGDESTCEKSYQ